jgi:thioredoxin reductase
VPVFPFFIINLVMGLTPIKTRTFYWVSQIGMLAGTAVYVNAGTQLARLESLSGILSPGLLGSFALLGIFPLLAKKLVGLIQARKVYAGWPKPARFERNLVVIGAGAGGLVTAYIAAAVKAKVTLIEGHKMGGDCLNYGCVPSKALIRSARFMKTVREAEALGIANASADADFGRIMARVQNVVRQVEPHDSVDRYNKLGVEVIQGHARITSPWTVEIESEAGKQTLSTRAIVIASGAAPIIPKIPGIESVKHVTSDTIWSLTEKPERLLVLGGGPIGCELAQAFAGIGCQVTLLARSGIMGKEDADAVALVEAGLAADGVQLLKGLDTVRCEIVEGEQRLIVAQGGIEQASRSMCCSARPAARRGSAASAWRNWAFRSPKPAPSKSTSTCKPATPTSTPAATSPGRSSSPTPPRIRPGTRRSTPCSPASRHSRPITGSFPGSPSPARKWRASGCPKPRPRRGASPMKSPATASTTSTGPLPTAPRTAS